LAKIGKKPHELKMIYCNIFLIIINLIIFATIIDRLKINYFPLFWLKNIHIHHMFIVVISITIKFLNVYLLYEDSLISMYYCVLYENAIGSMYVKNCKIEYISHWSGWLCDNYTYIYVVFEIVHDNISFNEIILAPEQWCTNLHRYASLYKFLNIHLL